MSETINLVSISGSANAIVDFGYSPNDVAELHIFNVKDVLIESIYNSEYKLSKGLALGEDGKPITKPTNAPDDSSNINNILLDIQGDFRKLGYISGKFNFQYNFHRHALGSDTDLVTITSINTDKTQISVLYNKDTNFEQSPLFDNLGNQLEYYFNIGGNVFYRIVTFTKDKIASKSGKNVYILKFEKPAPGNIQVGTTGWVDIQLANSIRDTIVLYPKPVEDPIVKLHNPNFNISATDNYSVATGYKTWDDILGTNPTSSQQLINQYISGSNTSITLNVDYSDYSNFIFYSSATDRLNNFVYKLRLLEEYNSISSNLQTLDQNAGYVSNNVIDVNNKINTILSGFDGYENYLYYQSSSYVTNSYGEFTPTTWPKSASISGLYELYPVDSVEGQSWLTGQLSSASVYDKENINSLAYLIPEHIREGSNNDSYVTFVNMVGHHFDLIRLYIENITTSSDRHESIEKGIAKDLLYHVIKGLGIDVNNGFKIEDLWLYALGVNEAGNYAQTGSMATIPSTDITTETWKRILNNLPYLLKTKGTERGIRALINCYGIPSTILRVREFSGPYQWNSNLQPNERKQVKDKFTYSLAVSASGPQVYALTDIPSVATELRIKLSGITTTSTQSIISLTNVGLVIHKDVPTSGSDWGSIWLFDIPNSARIGKISGPFYNGSWWNVALNIVSGSITDPVAQIMAMQQKDGVIIYDISSSWLSASVDPIYAPPYVYYLTLPIGGSDPISGSIQEFRAWDDVITQTVLREHTLNPQSIVGPGTLDASGSNYNYSKTYESLLARFPLGSDLARPTGSDNLISVSPQYGYEFAYLNDSIDNYLPEYETYYTQYPNLGTDIDINNRIRINDNQVDGRLSQHSSIEKNQYDEYFLDTSRIGVYFSPQDESNEDIADQFAGLQLDQFIGDPRDERKFEYSKLTALRHHYGLKKYGPDKYWKYIELLNNYDASLFYLIKNFLPGRATKLVGLVIQPTILERPVFPRRDVEVAENESFETVIEHPGNTIIGEYDTYTASIDNMSGMMSGIDETIEATLIGDIHNFVGLSNEYFEGAITTNKETLTLELFENTVNEDSGIRFEPLGDRKAKYLGTQISSRGFNIPSPDTFDGKPVVEFWNANPRIIVPAPKTSKGGNFDSNNGLNNGLSFGPV